MPVAVGVGPIQPLKVGFEEEFLGNRIPAHPHAEVVGGGQGQGILGGWAARKGGCSGQDVMVVDILRGGVIQADGDIFMPA